MRPVAESDGGGGTVPQNWIQLQLSNWRGSTPFVRKVNEIALLNRGLGAKSLLVKTQDTCITRVLRRGRIIFQPFQTLLQPFVSLQRLSCPTHCKTTCFVTPLLPCSEAYMYA